MLSIPSESPLNPTRTLQPLALKVSLASEAASVSRQHSAAPRFQGFLSKVMQTKVGKFGGVEVRVLEHGFDYDYDHEYVRVIERELVCLRSLSSCGTT